jgi:hypothetical protein
MWRFNLIVVLIFSGQLALGDDLPLVMPPPGSPTAPTFGQPGLQPTQAPSPCLTALPPVEQPAPNPRPYDAGLASWTDPAAQPAARVESPPVVSAPATFDSPSHSTWYFRQDAFFWNERVDSLDVVNEYGPISTLGYVRHSGFERFRIELFGGTVAYDGSAQSMDQPDEPYHQSFGTNYLGCRGEYDLLLEPASWSKIRFLLGVGTRFWIRDLRDAITPSDMPVLGYQETWWTFYPYVGLETKESDEPGLQFFGSARIGVTPLTYQHATYFDTVVWPRCGVTGQLELGLRYSKCSLSAFAEVMTWGASEVVTDAWGGYSFQPESRMVTVGGKFAYTF